MTRLITFRQSFLLAIGALVPLAVADLTLEEITDALACPRPDSFGPSTVIVEHEILEVEFTDMSELRALGQTFKDVYNKMNAPRESSEICDKNYLRAIEYVIVEPMEMKYKQYQGQKGYFREFLYKVWGKCLNCHKKTSLFDEGKARSKQDLAKLQDASGSACECSSTVTKNARAPTEHEFKEEFKEAVSKMAFDENGKLLQNTEDSERVIEVEGGRCPSPKDTFEYDVNIKLSVVPSHKDLVTVQDIFINSYNHMAPKYCDPDSHTVTSLTLTNRRNLRQTQETNSTRLLPATNNTRLLPDFSGGVRGSCLGCGSGSGVYDNGIRRLAYNHEEARRLWESSGCYCSIYPEGYRRPTVKEHAQRFNSALKWAHENGYLSEPIKLVQLRKS